MLAFHSTAGDSFPIMGKREVLAVMATDEAIRCQLQTGRSAKVEVVHKSVLNPEQVEASQGPGEWFWRWKALPDRPGKLYGFASPAAAAEDGIAEEVRWANYLRNKKGFTAGQWEKWKPSTAGTETAEAK